MTALTSVCLRGSGISFCSSGNFAASAPLPGMLGWRCLLSLIERVMTQSSSSQPASDSGDMPEGRGAPGAERPVMPGMAEMLNGRLLQPTIRLAANKAAVTRTNPTGNPDGRLLRNLGLLIFIIGRLQF